MSYFSSHGIFLETLPMANFYNDFPRFISRTNSSGTCPKSLPKVCFQKTFQNPFQWYISRTTSQGSSMTCFTHHFPSGTSYGSIQKSLPMQHKCLNLEQIIYFKIIICDLKPCQVSLYTCFIYFLIINILNLLFQFLMEHLKCSS